MNLICDIIPASV